jgi:prevent-host-death family protein
MSVWATQEAKQKFNAMIERALREGPQFVTRYGEMVAVVMSAADYERKVRPGRSFKEFLRSLPLAGLDLGRPAAEPRPDLDFGGEG